MAWKTIICISLALLAWGSAVKAYVPVSNNMRSFSSAIKGGSIKANEEKVLYEHSTGQSGVITEQWFTGVYVCVYTHEALSWRSGFARVSCSIGGCNKNIMQAPHHAHPISHCVHPRYKSDG